MDTIAVEYVKLVLALGEHDPDYVDAFYGPQEWRTEANERSRPLAEIRLHAAGLVDTLAAPPPADAHLRLRQIYLQRQLQALIARAEMLQGRQFSFDDESRALYDAEAPHHSEAEFADTLAQLACELPGNRPLSERVEAFRRRFVIPGDRLQVVFEAAIDLGRQKTQAHLSLPEGEQFMVEYVTNQPWSGYNWYQGGYKSLIQVNTDLPIFIDRALDLACHEGYPGHHVYNVLMERHLVRERGWPEYTVYALFSPQSLIAEGTANYGVDLALPEEERVAVERDLLFPLAGLEPSEAARYYRVSQLTDRLSYAGNEAARRYLDGTFTAEEAEAWLVNYNLMSPARAAQRLRFIQRYRSYVINYNLGKDLVRRHVEAATGSDSSEASRWACFVDLLKTPRVPSTLEVARRV